MHNENTSERCPGGQPEPGTSKQLDFYIGNIYDWNVFYGPNHARIKMHGRSSSYEHLLGRLGDLVKPISYSDTVPGTTRQPRTRVDSVLTSSEEQIMNNYMKPLQQSGALEPLSDRSRRGS
jgi:hypothetical protein